MSKNTNCKYHNSKCRAKIASKSSAKSNATTNESNTTNCR